MTFEQSESSEAIKTVIKTFLFI